MVRFGRASIDGHRRVTDDLGETKRTAARENASRRETEWRRPNRKEAARRWRTTYVRRIGDLITDERGRTNGLRYDVVIRTVPGVPTRNAATILSDISFSLSSCLGRNSPNRERFSRIRANVYARENEALTLSTRKRNITTTVAIPNRPCRR